MITTLVEQGISEGFAQQLSKLHLLGFREEDVYNTSRGKLLVNQGNESLLLVLDTDKNGVIKIDMNYIPDINTKNYGLDIVYNGHFVIVVIQHIMSMSIDIFLLEDGHKVSGEGTETFYKDVFMHGFVGGYIRQLKDHFHLPNYRVIIADTLNGLDAINNKGKILHLGDYVRINKLAGNPNSRFGYTSYKCLFDTLKRDVKTITNKSIASITPYYIRMDKYRAVNYINESKLIHTIKGDIKDTYLLGYTTCDIPKVLVPVYLINGDLDMIKEFSYEEAADYVHCEINGANELGAVAFEIN